MGGPAPRPAAGSSSIPAKMAAELRPPVPMDKGDVVEELCAGLEAAAFAGDDAGDLAAFAALDRLQAAGRLPAAVRIAVRLRRGPAELLGPRRRRPSTARPGWPRC